LKLIKNKKGQSMTEFAMILPVFLLITLGIVQITLIFLNTMILQYSAFAIARVAVAYDYSFERNAQIPKADSIMKAVIAAANNPSDSRLKTAWGMGVDSVQGFIAGKFQGAQVKCEDYNSIQSSDGRFFKVSVSYDMPLKVPFVNKIFGLFQNNASNAAQADAGAPVYTIKAYSIMRYQPEWWSF